jgi:cytochrome P450
VTSGEVSARVAIEEMIRWDAPLQLFERWVLDDGVELAGQPLARGEEVAMLFGSANRDPRRFATPDRFDAGRGDSAHVGFGGGIHFCVGAPLAREELDVSVDALARMVPDLHLAAAPSYHPTFVIRGLQALAVDAGNG